MVKTPYHDGGANPPHNADEDGPSDPVFDGGSEEEEGINDTERSRGILSEIDRKYLLGEKQYGHRQTRYDRERAIRERVVEALLDFALLYEYLPERDRQRIFNELAERDGADIAFASVFAFLYHGSLEQEVRHFDFGKLLEIGVREGEYRQQPEFLRDRRAINVVFYVESDSLFDQNVDISRIVRKIEQGRWHELTDKDLRHFIRINALTEEFDPDRVVQRTQEEREKMSKQRESLHEQ